MITSDEIMSVSKENIPEAAMAICKEDIPQLVEWLSRKEDKLRYQAFLLLQSRSAQSDDVYPYWDDLKCKLSSDNSYQRSIGLMLLAENVRWDTENKMEGVMDDYLAILHDEKPITVRQCIQSLGIIVESLSQPPVKIVSALLSLNLMDIKETMRKSILLDILHVLIVVRKEYRTDEIDSYIQKALFGGILDQKAKKQIDILL